MRPTAPFSVAVLVRGILASAAGAEDVVWLHGEGVATSGPTLSKTAGTSAWNAGAVSSKAIASDNGWVEFVAEEASSTRICGLSHGTDDSTWDDIDFGIVLSSDGTYSIREAGVSRGVFGTYGPGDRFRVAIEAGQIVYKRNVDVIAVGLVSPRLPLLVDASLYTPGAKLTNVTLSGATVRNVMWKNVIGAQSKANNLTRTSTTAFWDSGAVSTRALDGDGYAEFTATEANKTRVVGISKGDTDREWRDVDFGLYLTRTGGIELCEFGVLGAGPIGTYVAGDRFRIEVQGSVVRYRQNGVVIYTSLHAPQFPLLIDTALYDEGATVTNAVLSGQLTPNTPPQANGGMAYEGYVGEALTLDGSRSSDDGVIVKYAWDFGDGSLPVEGSSPTVRHSYAAAGSYQVRLTVTDDEGATTTLAVPVPVTILPVLPRKAVVWTDLQGTSVVGDELRKVAGADWEAGAVSTKSIVSGDGYVEFVAHERATWRLCGLGNGNTGVSYSDIEFGLYLRDGKIQVYEGYQYRGEFGAYGVGDVFRVSVRSGVVRYLKGGQVLYVSTLPPSYPLLVDTALRENGAAVKGAVLGGIANIPPVSNAGGSYYGAPGEPVTFSGSASSDTDGAIVEYTWRFSNSDGAKSGESVTHVFASAGTYTATLTVKDDDGAADPDTAAVSIEAPRSVMWKNVVGAQATGSSLRRTSTTAVWDSGAVSTRALAGDGYAEFTATEANKTRVVGLNKGDTDQEWRDIDFGLYLTRTGGIELCEFGVLGTGPIGTYVAGDRFRVEVQGSVVRYRQNGVVIHTSRHAPQFPLLIDTALYDEGATVTNAMLSGQLTPNTPPQANAGLAYEGHTGEALMLDGSRSTDDGVIVKYAWDFGDGSPPIEGASPTVQHSYASAGTYEVQLTVTDDEGATSLPVKVPVTIVQPLPRKAVVWTDLSGTSVFGDELRKVSGADWEAGAVSTKSIASGDGYVEFVAHETATWRLCGLGKGNSGVSYSDIEFGLYLRDGKVQVYEGFQYRGEFGSYGVGDVFRVWVRSGVVRYSKNGQVLYVSTLPPDYPLLVDTSLRENGAAIKGAVLGGIANIPPDARAGGPYYGGPGEPVVFSGSASDPDGTIVKYTWTFSDSPGTSKSGATVTHVFPSAGSYTATLTVEDDNGATDPDTATVTIVVPRSVVWKNVVGAEATGNNLRRTSTTALWDSGAVSARALTGSGYAEFMATEANTARVVGLSKGDTDQEWRDVDFGLYLSWSGAIELCEFGVLRDSPIGTYQAGDRFRIEVQGSTVRYLQNGRVIHTSAHAAQFPLLIDTALYSQGATVTNAVLSGELTPNQAPTANAGLAYEGHIGEALKFDGSGSTDADGAIVKYTWDFGDGSPLIESTSATVEHTYASVGTYGARLTVTDDDGATATIPVPVPVTIVPVLPKKAVVWTDLVGASVVGDELRKVSGPDWEAGAVSKKSIMSGDGYVEFVAHETATWRLCGLGTGNDGVSYSDVEFGLYLRDGKVQVYEKYDYRGEFGSYGVGDVFRVWVRSGVVRYLKNGRVLYVSTLPVPYPLRVDTALRENGAAIKAAVFARAINTRPIANPGGPYTTPAGPLTLNAQASSDPDGGDIVEYRWTFHDETVSTPVATIERTYATVGTFIATLTVVDDDEALSDPVDASIEVVPNHPPVLTLTTPAACHAPCTVQVTATTSDPEGRPVSLTWGGCAEGQFGPTVTCTMSTATTRVVSATASDAWNDPVVRQVTAESTNAVPSTPTVAVAGSGCTVPCSVTFTASATDPDGDSLAFAWGGCALGKVGTTAACRIEMAGTVAASVAAHDGRGGTASADATASGVSSGQSIPPESRPGGPYRGVAGRPISFDGRLSRDVDGQIVGYSWSFSDAQGGATGSTVTRTFASPGTFNGSLTVTDDDGALASQSFEVKVEANVDPDDDGLTNAEEQALGSNPNDADSNDDGIPDGAAKSMGLSLTSADTDADGASNVAELSAGTDPLKADSDGDGVNDGADAFPLDATRNAAPPPNSGDTTPPTITLERPVGAVEVR